MNGPNHPYWSRPPALPVRKAHVNRAPWEKAREPRRRHKADAISPRKSWRSYDVIPCFTVQTELAVCFEHPDFLTVTVPPREAPREQAHEAHLGGIRHRP